HPGCVAGNAAGRAAGWRWQARAALARNVQGIPGHEETGGTMKQGDGKLLEFPCEFPIKVMGRDADDFEAEVVAVFARHLGRIDPAQVRARPSSSGTFLSVTVTFRAESQEQLDALYRELTDNERVLFCL